MFVVWAFSFLEPEDESDIREPKWNTSVPDKVAVREYGDIQKIYFHLPVYDIDFFN